MLHILLMTTTKNEYGMTVVAGLKMVFSTGNTARFLRCATKARSLEIDEIHVNRLWALAMSWHYQDTHVPQADIAEQIAATLETMQLGAEGRLLGRPLFSRAA